MAEIYKYLRSIQNLLQASTALALPSFFLFLLHASEHVVTSSQHLSHFFRHVKGLLHTTHILAGFMTPRSMTVIWFWFWFPLVEGEHPPTCSWPSSSELKAFCRRFLPIFELNFGNAKKNNWLLWFLEILIQKSYYLLNGRNKLINEYFSTFSTFAHI